MDLGDMLTGVMDTSDLEDLRTLAEAVRSQELRVRRRLALRFHRGDLVSYNDKIGRVEDYDFAEGRVVLGEVVKMRDGREGRGMTMVALPESVELLEPVDRETDD